MKYLIKKQAGHPASAAGNIPAHENDTTNVAAGNAAAQQTTEHVNNNFKFRPHRSPKGKQHFDAPDKGKTLYEDESKRTAGAKHYVQNDGTVRAVYGGKPIHYYDEASNMYKDIDNTLIDSGSELVNKGNNFKVRFDKAARGGKVFDLESKDCRVSMFSDKLTEKAVCGTACGCAECGDANGVTFSHIDNNTDIEYLVEADRVKENIIIKAPAESYVYNFTLNMENLIAEPDGNSGSLILKNKATGKTEFTIPAPFMYDAEGVYSDAVYYEAEDTADGAIKLRVIADAGFINAEGRVFPVTVDPQIVVQNTNAYYYETLLRNEENGDYFGNTSLIVHCSGGPYNICTLMLINKSYLSRNNKVSSAKLILTPMRTPVGTININGTNYPASSAPYIVDITGLFNSTATDLEINFTTAAFYTNVDVEFETTGENAPKLLIDYICEEAPPVNQTFSVAGKAAGQLELSKGVYTTGFADIGNDSFILPVGIAHSYKPGGDNLSCGTNWRTNLHQQLKNNSATAFSEFVFTDEAGNKHNFTETYYYLDALNKKVYIQKASIAISIDGKLTYNGNEILKEQYCLQGLTIVPEIKKFINAELIEQRQDKQKQLEEYVESYKANLKEYVRVYNYDGSYSTNNTLKSKFSSDDRLTKIKFDEFVGTVSSGYPVMSTGEALQIQSYYLQQTAPAGSDANYDSASKALARTQKEAIASRWQTNLTNLKKLFKEYVNKEHELEALIRHTPVNFLKDENNIIRGFNKDGALVAIYDMYENAVMVEYDELGKLINVYDSENKQVAFNYNKAGLLDSITDDRGRKVSYSYEGADLKTITFADGSTLNFVYDNGNITKVTSADKLVTDIAYSGYKPTQIKTTSTISGFTKTAETIGDSVLSTVNIAYNEKNTTITDDSNSESYTFDRDRNLTKHEINKNGVTEETRTYDYVKYSKSNTTVTKRNAVDVITENVKLNQFNNPTKKETGWETIDLNTKVKTETYYYYDDEQRVTKEIAERQFDKSGVKTFNSFIKNYRYNGMGKLVYTESYVMGEELTAGVSIEENVYDEKGRQVKSVKWNSLDSSTKFYTESERAENGQITADIDETGENKTSYKYTPGTSIVTEETSPAGGKTAYGRDAATDEVTAISCSTEDGEANKTDTVYKYGAPVEVKSAFNKVNYEYDGKRRKTAVKLNDANHVTYAYTDNDTVNGVLCDSVTATMTGAAVKTSTDKNGNLIRVAVNSAAYVTNAYNSDNALLTSTDNQMNRTVTNTYDGMKRLYKSERKNGPVTELTEINGYNQYGKLSSQTITGAVSHSYSYTYKDNAARDLDYATLPGNIRSTPKSDVYGRPEESILSYNGNNILGQYTYYRKHGDHATNQVSSIRYGVRRDSRFEITEGLKYAYDKNGNIEKVFENGQLMVRYTYDTLNRLVREDNRKLDKTFLCTYDNNGNILSKREMYCNFEPTGKLTAQKEMLYRYDAVNGDRLNGVSERVISGSYYCGDTNCGEGHTSGDHLTDNYMAYDAMGNPTTYKGKTLVWQLGRQLASYDIHVFDYDGYGRRISKGSTTYTYSTNGTLLKQTDGINTLEFIYDNGTAAGVKINGTQYLYRRNLQGDVTHIYGIDGTLYACYTYDAWGCCTITTDINNIGTLNPIRYRGYYWDTETGLYFLQSRYYDPQFGRFINADDVAYLDAGTVNGLNLYAYCGGNPVMYTDSTGRYRIPIGIRLYPVIFSKYSQLEFAVYDAEKDKTKPKWMIAKLFSGELIYGGGSGVHFSGAIATVGGQYKAPNGTYAKFELNALKIEAGLGLGFDLKLIIVSAEVTLGNEAVEATLKAYIGYGAALDFSTGFKLSFAWGVGFEIDIKFKWPWQK